MSDFLTTQIPSQLVAADATIAALKTQPKPVVSDTEMMQAVRTLLLGLGEDPAREGW
jgi:GTP cyclohydrolase I